MKKIAEAIGDYYIRKEVIEPNMKPMYVHGISLILNDILNFGIILGAAVLLDSLLHGLLFTTVFYFLRVRCGGFHAKKEWICRVTMFASFVSVFLCTWIISDLSAQCIIIPVMVISVLILLPIIPVENPNKKLSDERRKKNKIYGIITIFLCSLSAIILTAYKVQGGIIIALTLLAVAVLAVIGKVVNKNREENEIEKEFFKANYVNDSRSGA